MCRYMVKVKKESSPMDESHRPMAFICPGDLDICLLAPDVTTSASQARRVF